MSKFSEFLNEEVKNIKENATESNLFIQGKLSEAIRIRAMFKESSEWIPAEIPPDNDRYILLNFDNFSLPEIGRYEGNEEDGGNYYCGDDDKSCLSFGLFVNAWRELPERYEA